MNNSFGCTWAVWTRYSLHMYRGVKSIWTFEHFSTIKRLLVIWEINQSRGVLMLENVSVVVVVSDCIYYLILIVSNFNIQHMYSS